MPSQQAGGSTQPSQPQIGGNDQQHADTTSDFVVCKYCNKSFKKRGIKNHIRRKHTAPAQQTDSGKKRKGDQLDTNDKDPKKHKEAPTIPDEWKAVPQFNAPVINNNNGNIDGAPVNILNASCYEIFMLFFTTELIQHFVKETNKYAIEKKVMYGNSILEVDDAMIKVFIGLVLMMGLVHFPSINDYFRDVTDKNPFYFCRIARKSMTRTLFKEEREEEIL